MTYADFVVAFPEFSDLAEAYVQAKLNEAAREISEAHWGTRFEDAQAYLAAHLLALTPMGFAAKLATPDGRSSYKTRLDDLRKQLPKRALLTGIDLP